MKGFTILVRGRVTIRIYPHMNDSCDGFYIHCTIRRVCKCVCDWGITSLHKQYFSVKLLSIILLIRFDMSFWVLKITVTLRQLF